MLISRTSRAVVVFLVFVLLAIVPSGASAQTEGDVERAEQRLEAARREAKNTREHWLAAQEALEAALFELDQVTTELERLEYTSGLLEQRIEAYDGEVAELRDST